jgi:hypothetical protein
MNVKEIKQQSYKQQLLECLALRQQGGKSAYKRAKILLFVYNDNDFRLDHNNFDDDKLANILDTYVEDLAIRFWHLKALLEYFPDEHQWAEGRLRSMLEEMQTAQDVQQTKPIQRRKTATVAEVEALKKQLTHEKARCQRLLKENIALREENQQLKQRLKKAA